LPFPFTKTVFASSTALRIFYQVDQWSEKSQYKEQHAMGAVFTRLLLEKTHKLWKLL
jgi:hypothetical protein